MAIVARVCTTHISFTSYVKISYDKSYVTYKLTSQFSSGQDKLTFNFYLPYYFS